jgi:uncharacterized protein (DUF2141 family)
MDQRHHPGPTRPRLTPIAAVLTLSLIMLASAPAASQASRAYTLTLVVEGVRNAKGVIGALVFRSPEGWPEDTQSAFVKKAVPAQPNRTTLQLSGLPPGDYAVVVLHDENENMKLDRNWLGRPAEQWGMSNNPRAYLAPPKFDRARFHLDGDRQLIIRLH